MPRGQEITFIELLYLLVYATLACALRSQGDLQELNSTLAWIYVTKVIYKS